MMDFNAEAKTRIKLQSRRPGIQLRIIDMDYVLSGILRRPRLRYKIQCGCGQQFHCWADKEQAVCPLCEYSAEMWVMQRECEEKSVHISSG
jgi:hypothetical protein